MSGPRWRPRYGRWHGLASQGPTWSTAPAAAATFRAATRVADDTAPYGGRNQRTATPVTSSMVSRARQQVRDGGGERAAQVAACAVAVDADLVAALRPARGSGRGTGAPGCRGRRRWPATRGSSRASRIGGVAFGSGPSSKVRATWPGSPTPDSRGSSRHRIDRQATTPGSRWATDAQAVPAAPDPEAAATGVGRRRRRPAESRQGVRSGSGRRGGRAAGPALQRPSTASSCAGVANRPLIR